MAPTGAFFMGERKVITVSTRKVWYSPLMKKTYLTRSRAIRAEAHAKIISKYPNESSDQDEYGRIIYRGFCLKHDEPDRYKKMLRRMMRFISKVTPK